MKEKLSPCLFICELSFFVPVKILGSLYRGIFKSMSHYLMDGAVFCLLVSFLQNLNNVSHFVYSLFFLLGVLS